MSLLGASAMLQVNGCGGWSLCLRQNSCGERLWCCRTSCRSDLAAITTHGVLLSMKYCCGDTGAERHSAEGTRRCALRGLGARAARTYLVHFGAVFEGAGVVDVIHQAHHVARQVRLRQEVKIWHHLVELEVFADETGERAEGRIKVLRMIHNPQCDGLRLCGSNPEERVVTSRYFS